MSVVYLAMNERANKFWAVKEIVKGDWGRLFQVSDDGGFYMADFIAAPEGPLKEIRFDKVHVRDFREEL